MEEELFGYRKAAAVLDVRIGTLYAMVSRRQIPHVRLGPRLVRFRASDLATWVRERSVVPVDRDRGTS